MFAPFRNHQFDLNDQFLLPIWLNLLKLNNWLLSIIWRPNRWFSFWKNYFLVIAQIPLCKLNPTLLQIFPFKLICRKVGNFAKFGKSAPNDLFLIILWQNCSYHLYPPELFCQELSSWTCVEPVLHQEPVLLQLVKNLEIIRFSFILWCLYYQVANKRCLIDSCFIYLF